MKSPFAYPRGFHRPRPLPRLAGLIAILLILTSAMASGPALADVGPPAHLQIVEREPGVFAVRWRVPTVLPARAVPMPQLPAGCEPVGEIAVTAQAGAWLFAQTWRCEGSLAGQEVGLRFPFPDLALTTVARVDLLSGDRFARLLTPGDPPWQLPEGTAAPESLEEARDAVTFGALHVAGSLAHVALVLAIALLGRMRRPLWLLGLFSLGQVAGALPSVFGFGVAPAVAEMAVGLAAVLLAREALRPEAERSRLSALAGVAGAAHGLALAGMMRAEFGGELGGIGAQLLAILGMDAAHLVGACSLLVLFNVFWVAWGATPSRPADVATPSRLAAHAAGALGAAMVLAVALGGGGPATGDVARSAPFDSAGVQTMAAVPASQRVAPTAPEVPMQTFLTVEPFEARQEVMMRLVDLADVFDLDPQATLGVAAQGPLLQRAGALVLQQSDVSIDGLPALAELRRVDFMSVDATGALPRSSPQPEPVADAIVGVVIAYPSAGMPQQVTLTWGSFSEIGGSVPATVIDPESVRSTLLSAEQGTLLWENELLDDPIPTLTAVPVQPTRLPVPLLSLPLFALAAVAMVRSGRGNRRAEVFASARVLLALALVVGPLLETSFAVPGSTGRLPTEAQARRLLAGLLPNVYRALEFREEERIYDRLAITVTGDTLTEVYLQQRRALELEERGGAQARVQAVEVLEAGEVEPLTDGFTVRSVWVVGGMVTHFGHRHFRQNRYDARIGVAAVDGTWKIRTIEVLEQERVQ